MSKRNCLKPLRMWIDGKCYNIRRYDRKKYKSLTHIPHKAEDQKIQRFSEKIHLPSIYYSKLVGYENPEINAVQSETNTIIRYPTNGKDGFLEILGETMESIDEAKEQMYSFIADIRNQLSALQFISIPLSSPEIKQNFEKFKEEILANNYQGVEESIFQSVLKLHLTIAVFTLLDDKERHEALDVLREVKNSFEKTEVPLKIRVKGLNCMNANYSKVNVLYAEASLAEDSKSEESLQKIADSILNTFYERGLCREYSENVKLHVTLMNTKYRKKAVGSPRKKLFKRETFDATQIMEHFKDYYFGVAAFNTIHLSLMSSVGKDGFYESLGTVQI
ncbi:activating signal cointegrator 1 complex subunit 1-like [Coccinella septempunctata]|uniref:activating signal cointegrator 1 complex subunit 1-like n=1 Tax=Coccinella septempunctata TaxID=41139 RepID=UPI001D06522A|nr:activating signal cointegrator 1 complex subunit 1-like [Coccinella septempunctata]